MASRKRGRILSCERVFQRRFCNRKCRAWRGTELVMRLHWTARPRSSDRRRGPTDRRRRRGLSQRTERRGARRFSSRPDSCRRSGSRITKGRAYKLGIEWIFVEKEQQFAQSIVFPQCSAFGEVRANARAPENRRAIVQALHAASDLGRTPWSSSRGAGSPAAENVPPGGARP